MTTGLSYPSEAGPTADIEAGTSGWRLPASTWLAITVVLVWFAAQLGRFIGEAPDLDAMISLRESIVFHREGLRGLIADRVGTGVHPPLMDALTSLTFALFGESPRSQQLLAIPLFAVVAAGVERALSPWLSSGQRVVATFAVAICPALAIVVALMAREGLILAILAAALAIAFSGQPNRARVSRLGAVLALLPLTKDASLVLVLPFAAHAAFDREEGEEGWWPQIRRGLTVLQLPVAASLAWRGALAYSGGDSWRTWIFSEEATAGPYVVALRAMLGLEDLVYLRQNLANAFLVNWLWVPAGLALVTIVLVALRRDVSPTHRRAVALTAGLVGMAVWTAFAFPTFTVPRYATPVILCTVMTCLLGLPLWPRRAQPFVLVTLIAAFALGAWSPTDPVSRAIWGTTSVGGERVYDTPDRSRGPDRMVINFATLRATERVNARLRRVFDSGVTAVTGDCNAMKFGEKLFSVGFQPSAFDGSIPGARPIRCIPIDELPAEAADGDERIGLLRTPEDDAEKRPLAISGPAIVVLH